MPDCVICSSTLKCKSCGATVSSSVVRRNCDGLTAKVGDINKRQEAVPAKRGVGYHLHAILAMLGINRSSSCACKKHEAKLDAAGIEWCESNIDTIEGILKFEATKRGIPYLGIAARMLIRRAIANARREAERAKDAT